MTEKIASAKFYRKPNHVRALQEDNSMVGFTPFQVVKVIHLTEQQYRCFSANLQEDVPFLRDNTALTGVDPHNGALRCLLICCRERQDGILVNSDGYSYARYAAYIPNRSALELKNIEHSSLQGKRRRSGPER